MNILIVKLSAIGDVIHTLPSLSALRKRFPQAHITWVVEQAAADLVVGHPYLDSVIVSTRKGWAGKLRGGNIGAVVAEMRELTGALRSRPYDLVIDFHGLFKSAVLAGLCRGKRKLGYRSLQELSGLFYTERIPEDMEKHAVDRYLDFARYLGADVSKPEFLIPVAFENERRTEALLKEAGIASGERFIAVSPVALWKTKLWSDEKFAALCDMMISRLGVKVVLTGGAAAPLMRIGNLMKENAVNLGGKTTLKDLAALYRRAALVVTTDSGPMHLAAATGTPVIALFGPTDPRRTGPYGAGHTVLQKSLPCVPCFKKNCEKMDCMRGIGVDEVFAAVEEKMKGRN
ncbi:MAG: glycosyltransferase family 9 protein [Smithellaceae bacterium]|nr:glycosyltransferase family 9 protein [Smithellaceae bacterium]